MKKLLLLLVFLPVFCSAQVGYINTIVGSGIRGHSGDGGPATAATIGEALSVFKARSGYTYITDSQVIRQINPSGTITRFAGGGYSYSDRIPATDAKIDFHGHSNMIEDAIGNIYFADDHRIRMVDISTGIISTIVGELSSGFEGDGGSATSARLNSPSGLLMDSTGNLYIGDEGNFRIRKLDTSGIINTIAGNTSGFSGDGGPATDARLATPAGMCMDRAGNLYVADRTNNRIRKITPTGIISTFAGNGLGGGGDGGPATAAGFYEPNQLSIDDAGNIYVADFQNSRVRKISTTGYISTYAGGGLYTRSGIPATTASFNDVWSISIDQLNNVYIADRYNYRICKVTGALGSLISVADSFNVYINPLCSGPSFTISPSRYSSNASIKTVFDDGTFQIDTFSSYTHCSHFSHDYVYARN